MAAAEAGYRPAEPSMQDFMDWQILRASKTPGPGEYQLPSTLSSNGGRMGLSKAKTELEWQIHRAKQTPGPADYDLPNLANLIPGGRMPKGHAKTDLDWVIYRAAQSPGPGEYSIPGTCNPSGGVMPKGKSKTELEWVIYRAAQLPAPHDYDVNSVWNYLDGNNGRKGAVMLGRNTGPSRMPAPFAQFSGDNADLVRNGPSSDYPSTLTPWRENSHLHRKIDQTLSSPDISGMSSAQSRPNELNADYEAVGRAMSAHDLEMERFKLEGTRFEKARMKAMTGKTKVFHNSTKCPWRSETWAKVAKAAPARPGSEAAMDAYLARVLKEGTLPLPLRAAWTVCDAMRWR